MMRELEMLQRNGNAMEGLCRWQAKIAAYVWVVKFLSRRPIPIHPMISPVCEGEIMSRNSSHFKWLPADDEDDAILFLSIEDKLI